MATWITYKKTWLRYFGPPEILITDGGSEFKGDFGRRLEQSATFQSVTDAEALWQNGRAERHGQWIQDLLEKECESNFVRNAEELELLSCELTAAKNRYLHRGGFSPF